MDKESKIMSLIIVAVFVGTLITGNTYYKPHFVEPVTLGFDEEWKIGSDIEIGTAEESQKIIPLLNFEYNGTNYTTYGDNGLPANLILTDKSALIGAGNERTFQGLYIEEVFSFTSNDDIICALYAIVEDNKVYYAKEDLYSRSYHKFTLEQEENKAVVNHHPNTSSFFLIWLMYSIGATFITFIMVMFYLDTRRTS